MQLENTTEEMSEQDVLRLSAGIVAAYVSRNPVQAGAISDVVRQVHGTLTGLSRPHL